MKKNGKMTAKKEAEFILKNFEESGYEEMVVVSRGHATGSMYQAFREILKGRREIKVLKQLDNIHLINTDKVSFQGYYQR